MTYIPCRHRTIGISGPATKREILDANPKRCSVFIYNSVVGSGCLIYLEDQAVPVVNVQGGESFTIENQDKYYGKIFAHDSAGLALIYVTEVSEA